MPWCPKCRFEYVPQIHVCPECKATLVTELPEEAAEGPAYGEGKDFEQVVLGTVVGEMHAALIGNALRAAGIRSRAQVETDAFLPGFEGLPRGPFVRYGIYVNRRDLEGARELWRTFEQDER